MPKSRPVEEAGQAPDVIDAIIVGAGFAGLYMLHKLREIGISARIYEAGSDVGGTWFWNRYPGARVDVESQEYSYSFSPELEAEWDPDVLVTSLDPTYFSQALQNVLKN